MLMSYNKFLLLLNKKQRIKTLILIVLLFFGMILEVLGIGLLLPFLEVISDQDIVNKYAFLENLFPVYFYLFIITNGLNQTYH